MRRTGRPSRGARTTFAAVVAVVWCVASCSGGERTANTERSELLSEAVDGPLVDPVDHSTQRGVEDPAAPRSSAPDDRPRTTLVAHVTGPEIVAHGGPASSRVVATFSNPNRHGTELVFQSLAAPQSELVDSGWIPVLLPIRPNGTVGWIRTDEVELTRNPYRIEVDVDDFTLEVYRNNDLHFETTVGIGEGDTPTPFGSFYLTDLLKPSDPGGVYGPYAYGLSGFSETLTSFNGGEGVIGIHGTNQPWAIGTRVSHGCIRVANDKIAEMAAFLPLGTPVVIDDDPSLLVGREVGRAG